MKNKCIALLLLGFVFAMLFYSCDRSPQVFSVNNFRSGVEENRKIKSVVPMPVKGMTGIWTGLEHQLKISHSISSGFRNTGNKPLKDTSFFIVEQIDTIQE